MRLVLLVIVLIVVFGGLPTWGYHSYGPWPSGLGLVLLLVLIFLMYTGRL